MLRPRYIYTLSDPDTGAIRYVGATTRPLKRLREHRYARTRRSAELRDWSESLAARGLQPTFSVVEVTSGDDWADRETWWIDHLADRGHELLNRHTGGDGPPSLALEQWSRDYAACLDCGRSDRDYAANGLCTSCYNRARHRRTQQPNRPYHVWSWDHACCVECGTTERPHKGMGLCENCFARHKRRLAREANPVPDRWARDYDRCVECGTTDRPHKARGLCKRCESRERYRRTTARRSSP